MSLWLKSAKVSLIASIDFAVNFDQAKKEQASEKAEIENEMIQMAAGMKEFANNFKTQFERDESVLHAISEKQDANIVKTNQENNKINKIEQGLMIGTFQKLFMLCVSLTVFVFMVMFIRMFPNKQYVSS